jgi:hypothetical protein
MPRPMRTTVRLDEQLLAEAKAFAARTGRTLTRVIEDALRDTLTRRAKRKPRTRVELPTAGGTGVLPGVDLDHGGALLDVMESVPGPR